MINARAFHQLALANWRELTRDYKVIIYLFVPPLLTLLVFPLIATMTREEARITLVLPADAAQSVRAVAAQLQASRDLTFEVVGGPEGRRRQESGAFEAGSTRRPPSR